MALLDRRSNSDGPDSVGPDSDDPHFDGPDSDMEPQRYALLLTERQRHRQTDKVIAVLCSATGWSD